MTDLKLKNKKTKRSEYADDVFFSAIERGETVENAANLAGYSKASVYRYRESDDLFYRRFQYAQMTIPASLEAEAIRRGRDGWDEPKFYKDRVIGKIRKYSDSLLITSLKAEIPHKYSDKKEIAQLEERISKIEHEIID